MCLQHKGFTGVLRVCAFHFHVVPVKAKKCFSVLLQFKWFLEDNISHDPLPCVFSMYPLLHHTGFKWMAPYQATAELDDELIIWNRCGGGGKHRKHAGRWVMRTGIEKHCCTVTMQITNKLQCLEGESITMKSWNSLIVFKGAEIFKLILR